MLQNITNSLEQTLIFTCLLGLAFLLSIRTEREPFNLSLLVTSELKGFAILTIIFGHIGYFLFTDHNFLAPLSNISGVGVDLFFLLSGYGLAISSIKKPYQPKEFYRRRIGKIFIPLWISLIIFLLLDAFILHHFYDWPVILKSFLGFYPQADIYQDLNSPLWYLTPLLFYYLIFPWLFKPRWPVLSAMALGIIAWGVFLFILPVSAGVHNLYSLHFLAFPLGVALANLLPSIQNIYRKILNDKTPANLSRIIRYLFLPVALGIFFYTFNSGGQSPLVTQLISLVCALSLITVFTLIKLHSRLLEILGNHSYEIYLLHWPLLYRFGFLYRLLPAGLVTALYIAILLGLAYLFQQITSRKKA